MCQEHLLKYSRRRKELLAAGINLTMISIGRPEIGRELMTHLDIPNGKEFVFADINNSLYDVLQLNTGLKGIINPKTAFAFRDRIFNGEMGEIFEVLGKWKNAVYVPPKGSQAFNQGGVFVLDHNVQKTLFAHYDEAVADHADIDVVTKLAIDSSSS